MRCTYPFALGASCKRRDLPDPQAGSEALQHQPRDERRYVAFGSAPRRCCAESLAANVDVPGSSAALVCDACDRWWVLASCPLCGTDCGDAVAQIRAGTWK